MSEWADPGESAAMPKMLTPEEVQELTAQRCSCVWGGWQGQRIVICVSCADRERKQ